MNSKWILPLALLLPAFCAAKRPGDQMPIGRLHPGYTLENIRPAGMDFPVGAMDFLSDGSLVVTSWKDPYGVFILRNATGPKEGITLSEFATGLTESLGLKVVDDRIYVLQKDELTLLEDTDKDGKADLYKTIASDWTKSVMEKEYAVGLVWDGKYFYGAFGDPTRNGGDAVNPAPAGRQNGVLQMDLDGKVTPFSGGMRVPGGLAMAYGEIWATENQGGYRPSNPLYAIRKGLWYGRPINPPSVFQPIAYREFPDDGPHKPLFAPAAIWMPYNEAGGKSPGNPVVIPDGPYKGQLLIGDATFAYGGISRQFLEKVGDLWQGATFHFTQGLDQRVAYRTVFGPDGALYVGANGSNSSDWGRNTYKGLQRLKPSGQTVFDMVAVRSTGPNTFAFEFTKPLDASLGPDVAKYLEASKWWERPQEKYGFGHKTDQTALAPASAKVGADRKTVTVTLPNLTEDWVYYFHWKDDALTSGGEKLWGTEAWYTLNHFGPGVVSAADPREQPGVIPFHLAGRSASGIKVKMALPADIRFEIRVADLGGRAHVVRSGRGREDIDLPLASLPRGVYALEVRTGARSYSRLIDW
jgi:cytochrome c